MAVTFAAFAAVATVGGAWVVRANQYGRISLVVLAIFGLTLLWPALADWLSRPFVQLGSRLSQPSGSGANPGTFRSLLLGVATGLLWAPCAGPILGLILTGAALEGASERSVFLLLGLCRRRRDFAGRGVAGGRASFRRAQAIAGSGGVDTQHLGRGGAGGRGGHCVGPGSRPVDAGFAGEHIGVGTIADRSLSCRTRNAPNEPPKKPAIDDDDVGDSRRRGGADRRRCPISRAPSLGSIRRR